MFSVPHPFLVIPSEGASSLRDKPESRACPEPAEGDLAFPRGDQPLWSGRPYSPVILSEREASATSRARPKNLRICTDLAFLENGSYAPALSLWWRCGSAMPYWRIL